LEVNEHLRFDDSVGVAYIFSKWVEKLNSIEDACVEIAQESPPIFEYW
jgi:HD superfamily phosphohydrolase